MNAILNVIGTFFKSLGLSLWTAVSGALTTVLNEVPDDEIAIMHGAMSQFSNDLAAGKSWGEAAADVWTYVQNQEGKELGKVANLFLQAFIAKFEPVAVASVVTGD